MDIRKIKKLIELLETTSLTELEVHEGEESVRLSKAVTGVVASLPQASPVVTAGSPDQVAVAPTAANEPEAPAAAEGHTVKSPMVGTFYRASAPDNPPFVEVGDSVAEGDVLCIVEAMKLMNQIESDISGRVKAILVENGQPVEFGQPIMIIG